MKKEQPRSEVNEVVVLAFIVAWGLGGVAVGVTELALTGQNLLDSGGEWQSWLVGALASVVSFVGVIAWGRRKAPPTK